MSLRIMGYQANAEFTRLSPRMRECLRLVYDRKRTGEIATMLGIEEGTAKSYIADAVRVLGARDRIDAAERLRAYEALNTPTSWPPPSGRVAIPLIPAPTESGAASPFPRWLLPVRQRGATDNELTIAQRALWIAAIPIIVAIAFGMLATGLRVVSELAHELWGFRH